MYVGLWLLVSTRLPRREAHWRELLPGAILFAVGIQLLGVVTALPDRSASIEQSKGPYGALGLAASLLLGLFFFITRLIVATAVVNATLHDRRRHGQV